MQSARQRRETRDERQRQGEAERSKDEGLDASAAAWLHLAKQIAGQE